MSSSAAGKKKSVLLLRDIVLLVRHNMCLCMSAGYLKTNEGK